jgi:D-glycero-D-manno-heptose 1,7-bisphosphate phosphatase
MSEHKPALFIDRDGTINRDCPYCHDPSQIDIYMDAVSLIRDYRKKGYLIIVITNQSGLGRHYFSIQDLDAFNEELNRRLKELGAQFDYLYYCPHIPEDNCDCRKPKDGMIRRAVQDHGIDLDSSALAGDRDDIEGELARKLGLKFIHFRRD